MFSSIVEVLCFIIIVGLVIATVVIYAITGASPLEFPAFIKENRLKSALKSGDLYRLQKVFCKTVKRYKGDFNVSYPMFVYLSEDKRLIEDKERFFKTYSLIKDILKNMPTYNMTKYSKNLLSKLLDELDNLYTVNKDGIIVKIDLDNQKIVLSDDNIGVNGGISLGQDNYVYGCLSICSYFCNSVYSTNEKYKKYEYKTFVSTPSWAN